MTYEEAVKLLEQYHKSGEGEPEIDNLLEAQEVVTREELEKKYKDFYPTITYKKLRGKEFKFIIIDENA